MNRGPRPQPTRPAGQQSFAEKLAVRLGDAAPDWLVELATFADQAGLKRSGEKLGYSPATISQTISGQYRGDIGRVEEAVRGALMGLEVTCPVLGEIGRDRCLKEQKQPFRSTSALRAQLYHACRRPCPNARTHGGDENAE